MKNPKSGAKGSSSAHKTGPSAHKPGSSAAADRKSRWESAAAAPSSSNRNSAPSSSNRNAAAPSTDTKPKPSPNPIPPAPFSPHDHPIPPHLQPLAAASPAAAAHPAPPSYGFHNLDRRTIVLADGSVRSYFALPPDYPMDPPTAPDRQFFPPGRPEPHLDRRFPPPDRQFSPDEFREPPPLTRRPGGGPAPPQEYWSSLNLDSGPRSGPPPEGGLSSLKRKYGEDDEFAWHRQHVQQYGNPNGIPLADRPDFMGRGGSPSRREYQDERRMSKQAKMGGDEFQIADFPGMMGRREEGFPPWRGRPEGDGIPPAALDVDRQALKRAFLKYAKSVNENLQRKNYLEDGKHSPLKCIVCRASKEFADVHELVMHAYNTQNADVRVDHLGLHKALCVLLGWNFAKAPEGSKAYQSLSVDDVDANRDDLILWPPTVIIHNTNTGRRKDGRMEGLGNKDMDTKLKELGFGGGKSKSLYGKEGHTGLTVVKFANTQAGLKEAERVTEYFEKDNHGRKGWGRVQASQSADDNENPALVKVDEKTGEKKRIFYGYLATASDLEKIDLETRKKAVIKSRREFDLSE